MFNRISPTLSKLQESLVQVVELVGLSHSILATPVGRKFVMPVEDKVTIAKIAFVNQLGKKQSPPTRQEWPMMKGKV